jgi:hypothetical protein
MVSNNCRDISGSAIPLLQNGIVLLLHPTNFLDCWVTATKNNLLKLKI